MGVDGLAIYSRTLESIGGPLISIWGNLYLASLYVYADTQLDGARDASLLT